MKKPTETETFDFASVNKIPDGLADKYPNGLSSKETAKVLNLTYSRTLNWLKNGVIKGNQPQRNAHHTVPLEVVATFATKMSWRVRWELLE